MTLHYTANHAEISPTTNLAQQFRLVYHSLRGVYTYAEN